MKIRKQKRKQKRAITTLMLNSSAMDHFVEHRSGEGAVRTGHNDIYRTPKNESNSTSNSSRNNIKF